MIKIAITGSIASGKSLVESFLKQEGAVTLDTDKIVHELLKNDRNIINRVYELFSAEGLDVRGESGSIDRKKVGQIVFSDEKKRKNLEKIIHPEVKKIVEDFFRENQDKELAAVSVPLLFEAGMESMFDYVIAVTADENLRLERLVETRGLTREQALNRIKAQDFNEKKLKKADFVIENNNSPKNLRETVKNIIKNL